MEYFVSKLSFSEDEKLIQDVFVHEYNGEKLNPIDVKSREWMVSQVATGHKISTMTPNPNDTNKWIRGKEFSYVNNLFSWDRALPKNITKRKTFLSYYHRDNQDYRDRFERLFHDLIVSKSVNDGDIDSDSSDEYIKQLIQKEYLYDVTVLVVLLGAKTFCRKHVDWEISAALNYRVGDKYSGLIGILLPSHPDYNTNQYKRANLPQRLAANIDSRYAKIYNWTEDRAKMQAYIEEAFANRSNDNKIINKAIAQMNRNLCD